jgi:hypothetical protein
LANELFIEGHALVIGVGADLPNTIEDARGLADIIKDPGRCAYPPKQVRLLTGPTADRLGIMAELDQLANNCDEKATVVVYFSGHGYQIESSFGKSYFLMPYGYDINRLSQTAISGSEFVDKLKAIRVQKLLLLLDCCYAGGLSDMKAPGLKFNKAPLPPEAHSLLAQGLGRVIIASSQADEVSYTGKPYSAFTAALIEALCGTGMCKKDGYVRVADLAMYIGKIVPQCTDNLQNPILNFDRADNFVLAYYAGGETQLKTLPFTHKPEIDLKPEKHSSIFDQRRQTVYGPQTNIAGIVQGPVLSGQFNGPVALGGEAVDMRGSTGAIYKPNGSVSQHFGDKIEIYGDGNVVGSGSAAVLKAANIDRFQRDLKSLRQALQDANLDEDTVQAVDADLETVQTQAGKERPNRTMIMSKLRSATEILASFEGSVGTMERLQALALSLLNYAGRLFG